MSSARSVSPHHVELHPSRRLRVLLTGLYLGALVSVVQSPLPVSLMVLFAAMVLLSYPVSLNRIGWFEPASTRYSRWFRAPVTGLSWREGGEWELYLGDAVTKSRPLSQQEDSPRGAVVKARLLPATTVLPFITVLNFYCEQQPWYHRRIALVLLPDSLSAEHFRQLRVHLLTQPQTPADSAAE